MGEETMIEVEAYQGKAVTDHTVEIVERKGVGHPDYICDAVMDAVSVALCRLYLEEFGTVLHHNIDKGLLVAGGVETIFGGGRLVKPMELIIGDRATLEAQGQTLPVDEVAVAAARDWVHRHLRHVDPDRHLDCRTVLSPGSTELTDIFRRSGAVRVANDTSAAVGYAPLSPLETAVFDLERYLNGAAFKERFPASCEDVKVMGLRRGAEFDVTVAMPLLSHDIHSEREYFECKDAIRRDMQQFLENYQNFASVRVHYNTLDEAGRGLGGIYLSLLGTSAEDADSGQVGRGNRVNGLISLNRPLGTEAAAGKNPVSHVGKIYNVLAHETAQRLYAEVEGLKEAYVFLQSRIGRPIDQPVIASAQLVLEAGREIDDLTSQVKGVMEEALQALPQLCERLIRGEMAIC